MTELKSTVKITDLYKIDADHKIARLDWEQPGNGSDIVVMRRGQIVRITTEAELVYELAYLFVGTAEPLLNFGAFVYERGTRRGWPIGAGAEPGQRGNVGELVRAIEAGEWGNTPPYREFRRSGWPLCPNCGEDELWCPGSVRFQMDNRRAPTIKDCLAMGLRCHWCLSEFEGVGHDAH